MKFKINDNHWEIVELDTKELVERYGEPEDFMFGFCSYTENKIYLNSELVLERKRHTLVHELTHCWTFEHGWGFDDNINREQLCNIVASIHVFIEDIVRRYFK